MKTYDGWLAQKEQQQLEKHQVIAKTSLINMLIKVPGILLKNVVDIDPFDFVHTIAIVRIMMPKSYICLSAGREKISDELQGLYFFVGVNSILYGKKLLIAQNPVPERDDHLFQRFELQKSDMAY